jgi:integrase
MAGKRERTRWPGIYKLQSGLYQAIIRVDGRQRSASFPTLAQARDWRTRTLAAAAAGTYVDPAGGRFLLWEWVDLWQEGRRVRATTKAKDQSRLTAHILPAFGNTPIGRITQPMVKAWVRGLEDKGLAPDTVKGVYQLLVKIMADAVEADLIGRSPCRGIRFDTSRPPPREARALTTAEASRLLKALHRNSDPGAGNNRPARSNPADRPHSQVAVATPYTLVLTTLGTGLRWGEVAGLRRRNIHLLGRPPSLEVVESLHEANGRLWWEQPKNRSSIRRVPLPAVVAQALAAHLPANGEPDDLVFTSPQGGPLRRRNFATRAWLPALEAAGLEGLRFHELRHTVASWLADAGIPEVIVAAVLGHKVGPSMTAGYTSVVAGFEDRVLAALDERLSSEWPPAAGRTT